MRSILVIQLIAFMPWVGALCADQTPNAKSAELRRLQDLASSLDPIKDEKPRALLKDGHLSPFGLQFHPACLKYSKEAGTDRETAIGVLDKQVLETFKQMMECREKYPEIDPYVREWVSQFRRTVVACTSKTMAETKNGGMNNVAAVGLYYLLTKEEYAGIEGNGLIGPMNRNHQPTMILPRDVITKATNKESALALDDTLIHETFHATHANNRQDHDKVELVEYSSKDACGKNISMDRVNMLSFLCSHRPVTGPMPPMSVPMVIYEKTNQCGPKTCETLFSGETESLDLADTIADWYNPSEGLPVKSAQSLCSKLYDEGHCKYLVGAQGPLMTKTNKELARIGDKLRERLSDLFPNAPVQFSAELFKVMPAARKKIMESASHKCLDSVFDPKVAGDALYVIGAKRITAKEPTPQTYSDHAINEAYALATKSPACNPKETAKLQDSLIDLQSALDIFFNSSGYRDLIKPRYRHEAESRYWPLPSDEFRIWRPEHFLGDGLYTEYKNALMERHYLSPDFNCKKNGLSLSGTLTMFGTVSKATKAATLTCGIKK